MWVPVASCCKGAAQTGPLIELFITRSIVTTFLLITTLLNTATNQVGRRRRRRHRRRGDIDHPRGMGGAGTVRVAHDHQGHPNHHRCGDRHFFPPRNRSR